MTLRRTRTVPLLAAAALVAGGLVFLGATPASAATFNVNSSFTQGDVNPGNGVCLTVTGHCTLRAAIEEANALPGEDVIVLPAGIFRLADRAEITDDVRILGLSASQTTITGEDESPLFRARTEEYLVCDSTNDRIRSYHDNGTNNGLFVTAGTGGLDQPVAAHVGRDGDVFVSGLGSGVHRFDGPTGDHEGVFADPGLPTDAVFGPSDEGTHFEDNLYATSFLPGGGIERFDGADGSPLGTFVSEGDAGLSFPNSMVFRDGDLFVTSAASHEVLRFDGTTGNPVGDGGFVAPFAGGLSTPRGLMFAPDGSLLVASGDSDEILRYNGTTGAFLETLVTAGSGGLDNPTGLALGHDGSLLVVSIGSKQVLRYNISTGAFREVFVQGGNGTMQQPSCILPRGGMGAGPTIRISSVTMADGDATLTGDAGAALITDIGSRTTIADAVIRDHASNTLGGAISNFGRLTLQRVEVRDNSLPSALGGGVTARGGAIYNQGVLRIESSTIAGNIAIRGGGLANSGGGRMDILNSTISGNTATGGGGGIHNAGEGSVVRITMSTITDNQANVPGQADDEENRFGGGILNLSQGGIAIGSSIVANNTDNRSRFDASFSPDCHSPDDDWLITYDYNVWGILSSTCALSHVDLDFVLPNERIGTEEEPLDPGLQGLANNGGLTRTHALTPGSPAIDFKTDNQGTAFFNSLPRDQRNAVRPADGDGNALAFPDAGAYERSAVVLPPFVLDLPLALQLQFQQSLCPERGSFCVPLDQLTAAETAFFGSLSRAQLRQFAALPPGRVRQFLTRPSTLGKIIELRPRQLALLLQIEPRRLNHQPHGR